VEEDQTMPIDADARPDLTTTRVQVLLAARGGCREEVAAKLETEGRDASARLGGAARVVVLAQIENDPFPKSNPLCRPYDAVLEVESSSGADLDTLLDAVDGIGERLCEVVHADLSGVLVGAPQFIIPCQPTPVRYLYLMRRKAHTTREHYVDYYFHHHSNFGLRTPGIVGYTQFHVDLAASSLARRRLNLGLCAVDSVSELCMRSLDEFFAALVDDSLGREASADELHFVDRDNSVSFCTTTRLVLDADHRADKELREIL
jgi:hypothetical protein